MQKQFQQQHLLLEQQHHHQNSPLNYQQEIIEPGFSYFYPTNTKNNENQPPNHNEPFEFALQPFDSRYYEKSKDIEDNAGGYENADEGISYFNNQNSERNDVFTSNNQNSDESEIPTDDLSLIPPPMHVLENKQTDRILHRNQMKPKNVQQQQQDVMQKPIMQVDFDNTMSLYVVALIAGLSCAFSTGVSQYCKRRVWLYVTSKLLKLKFYLLFIYNILL